MSKQLYEVGNRPPLGEVPEQMHAWLIRPERFGKPTEAFQKEVVNTPSIADDEVLVYVMAAGINYNNVWAGLGVPVNVIAARNKAGEPEDFHIGGSDASGIVYAVGKDVTNVKVGDEVVMHCGTYDRNCAWVKKGGDPMYSPSFKIWGYETNYGSFAQFTRVQAQQCMPKPKHMNWEQAAAYVLVAATAWRMLHGWESSSVKKGDVALIWGGAGGLGSMAIQIAKAVGATSVAIVSGEDKYDYCMKLGAKGCINRNDFDHWGMLPHWKDNAGYAKWLKGVRGFGAKIWEVLGEKRAPNIVFEHPGETPSRPRFSFAKPAAWWSSAPAPAATMRRSICATCGCGRSACKARISPIPMQCNEMNELALRGQLDPCMSRAFTYEELPIAHQLMHDNKHPHGNMSVLIGATEFGLGASGKPAVAMVHPTLPKGDVHTTPAPYPMSTPLPGIAEGEPITIADDGSKVRDLMHLGIISCTPDDTIGTVAKIMVDKEIHAVVVMDAQGKAASASSRKPIWFWHGRAGHPIRHARCWPARS
jgi:crotonyl-CoA carboxylase/reductase